MIKGGMSNSQLKPYGIHVTTDARNRVIKYVCGLTKVGLDLIWYNDWETAKDPSNAALYQVTGNNPSKKTGGKKGAQTYYSAAMDWALGLAPIVGVLAAYYNNQKFECPILSATAVVSGGVAAFTPPSGAVLAALVAVTVQESYSATFDDYGGPGSQTESGTWQRPLWNSAFAQPGNIDPSTAFQPAAGWFAWDGSSPQVTVPTSLNGKTMTIYFAVPQILQSDGEFYSATVTSLGLLNLELELACGSGSEYANHPSQQILNTFAAGVGSSRFDLGAADALPNLTLECQGNFTLWPNGDCDAMDIVTDVVFSGPVLIATEAGSGSGGGTTGPQPSSVVYNPVSSTTTHSGALSLSSTSGGIWITACGAIGVTDGGTVVWTGFGSGALPSGAAFEYTVSVQQPSPGPGDETIFVFDATHSVGIDVVSGTGSVDISGWDLGTLEVVMLVEAGGGGGATYDPEVLITLTFSISGAGGSGSGSGSTMLAIPHGVNCNNYPNGGYFSPQFPPSNGPLLDDLTAVRAWCTANGIHVALCQDTQRPAIDLLKELLKVANCAPVYSGALLKLIPLDEVSSAGNGAVYTAPTASGPLFNLTDQDIVFNGKKAPIRSSRDRRANCDNVVSVEFVDRTIDYADNAATMPDACSIALYGTRKGGTLDSSAAGVGIPSGAQQMNLIHDPAVAQLIASILVKVSAACVNVHAFAVMAGLGFYLEAGDLVTITDPRIGFATRAVRLTSVKENVKDKTWDCQAEDFIYGLHHPDPAPTMKATGTLVQANLAPGSVNAPVILEPSSQMLGANAAPQIWFVVSGPGTNYGGCVAHISIDGGDSYSALGNVGAGTTGVLMADFPEGTDPDTTDALAVDLTESNGSLAAATQATANAFADPCYIATPTAYEYEEACPTAATLTAPYQYSLGTYIRRGCEGTPSVDHPSGSRFAVLNGAVLMVDLDAAWVGLELYFKFTAYNLQKGQQQFLGDCTPYTYTPVGLPEEQLFLVNGE